MTGSDTARIYARLDEIKDAISDLRQQVAARNGRCDGCNHAIDTLQTVVFGNGGVGLKTQVDVNRSRLDAHIVESTSDKMWRRTAILSGAIAAMGWAATLYAALRGG